MNLLEDSHLKEERWERVHFCFQKHLVLWFSLFYLADGDDQNGEDEDGYGHPRHVGFEAPGLGEVAPTFIHTWSQLRTGKDKDLQTGKEMSGGDGNDKQSDFVFVLSSIRF